MMVTPWQLGCGVAVDLALGDPPWLPHPIVGVGRLAAYAERFWRATKLPLRAAGIGAWASVVGVTCCAVYLTIQWLPQPYIQIYWIWMLLAVRGLDDHAMSVMCSLQAGDLVGARLAVARIVGRDTANLDEREVTRATVETVAENLSDGVIAPMFWLVLGGPVGMAGYKAVNTMDSMFGYKNARFLEFGWCAARMDDLANWIPARITAGLVWLVALLWPGMNFRQSICSTWRDAHRQPSPNSGYPEAAAAGALGVQLGGTSYYHGVRSEKALLGDDLQTLDWRTYKGMRILLYGATLLFVVGAAAGARWL